MIPITVKREMVRLLGRVVYWEKAEVSWMKLSFDEKMIIAEKVLLNTIKEIKQ